MEGPGTFSISTKDNRGLDSLTYSVLVQERNSGEMLRLQFAV